MAETQAAGAGEWTAGLTEPTRNFVTAKGYKTVEDLAVGYINAEKLIGADKIALPAKDTPLDKWEGWAKLGAPEKPEGYAFKKPEGMNGYDEAFAGKFREFAHKQRIPAAMALAAHDWWVGEVKTAGGAAAEAAARTAREAGEKLDREMAEKWGAARNEKTALAQRAAKFFGFKAEQLGRLEATLGDFALMEAFARIGGAIGEDKLVAVAAGAGGIGTPEQAKAELDKLSREAASDSKHPLINASHPSHKETVARQTELYKLAFPGQVRE